VQKSTKVLNYSVFREFTMSMARCPSVDFIFDVRVLVKTDEGGVRKIKPYCVESVEQKMLLSTSARCTLNKPKKTDSKNKPSRANANRRPKTASSNLNFTQALTPFYTRPSKNVAPCPPLRIAC
jgi:hypothetical protein